MSYATLMARLQLGRSNADLLNVAADLAERFRASIAGVAACEPAPSMYNVAQGSQELIDLDLATMRQDAQSAKVEFEEILGSRIPDIRFCSMMNVGPLAECVANEARSADLLITNEDDAGALAMQCGRPVLVVPTGVKKLELNRIVVGWKDTRESRRAIMDALPFLRAGRTVAIVEITDSAQVVEARSHLDDVVAWLKRHQVQAKPMVAPSVGEDTDLFNAIVRDEGAGLVVAGAYGHSRLREWIFGGMTSNLLLQMERCSLISH